MTKHPKTYEGTKYVSHTIERVELRRAPVKRWKIVVDTEVPEGATPLAFEGLLDISQEASKKEKQKEIGRFIGGMRKRWNKRTSESDAWIESLESDLVAAVDEG
jgi:hypothetical protein